MPRAFIEHGVLMLGSLLNSDTAIQTSLLVVRAFVKLRALLSSHTELRTITHSATPINLASTATP
jgi:hypothetical protein